MRAVAHKMQSLCAELNTSSRWKATHGYLKADMG